MKRKTNVLFYLLCSFSAFAQIGIGKSSPRAALDINKDDGTHIMGLLLPTNSDVNNIINPLGAGIVPGTVIYDSTYDCIKFYKKTNVWSDCISDNIGNTGNITALTCISATNSGTLAVGIVASGVSSSVPYTGGNGGSHSGQTVTSTGVTGLTATLAAGDFATGSGSLSYTITGTPSASGTANFALNIGGQTCNLTRTVSNQVGTITALTCTSATNSGTLTAGTAASGVFSSVPYTGGNGGSHTGQTVTSTGVTGLTATLSAGDFASGSGSLSYTITGTPSEGGTASFALNIGGKTCTLTRTVGTPANEGGYCWGVLDSWNLPPMDVLTSKTGYVKGKAITITSSSYVSAGPSGYAHYTVPGCSSIILPKRFMMPLGIDSGGSMKFTFSRPVTRMRIDVAARPSDNGNIGTPATVTLKKNGVVVNTVPYIYASTCSVGSFDESSIFAGTSFDEMEIKTVNSLYQTQMIAICLQDVE